MLICIMGSRYDQKLTCAQIYEHPFKVTATPDIILKALRHKEDSDKNANPLSLMHLDDDPLLNPFKCSCKLQETCGHDSCDSDSD